MSAKVEAALHGLGDAERAWVLARVAEAPPLSEAQVLTIAAVLSSTEQAAS